MKKQTEFWMGDDVSFLSYLDMLAKVSDPELFAKRPEATQSSLLDIHGNVGIINIQGGISATRNWMTDWLGVPTYPDIRDALVEAAQNDSIDHILLDINSPGGSAAGIEDISQLITKIKAEKPVTAFTGNLMASAGYWIGSTADKVYSSPLATVGSIGVISTHFDLTKMMENDGVKVTIFRAGEFKALGSQYEAVTPKFANQMEERMGALYDAFVSHVAANRHVSTSTVHSKMADGREFLGTDALKAGLIDGITSIDDLMSSLQKSSRKTANGRPNTTRMEASDMKKKLLTEQAVAVLEAGGSVDEALENAPAADEADPAASIQTTEPENAEVNAEATTAPETPEVAAQSDSLVSYLKTELTTANEKVMESALENRNLKTQLDTLNATHSQMREIVMGLTNFRSIALGGRSSDLSNLSDEALLQQHAQVTAEFTKTYPIGGKISAPNTDQPAANVTNQKARMDAVRLK